MNRSSHRPATRRLTLSLAALLVAAPASPCTSILVSRGASVDGSTMVTYAAESNQARIRTFPLADPATALYAKDVGAGPFALPYRWRPMTWEVDGGKYVHERAISTQQTGYSLVSQSRGWRPDPIGGVLARDYLTDYSVRAADETVARWRQLGESLVSKYPDSWYRRIVSARGEALRNTGPED